MNPAGGNNPYGTEKQERDADQFKLFRDKTTAPAGNSPSSFVCFDSLQTEFRSPASDAKDSRSGGQMPPLRFILSEKYSRCACVPSAGFCANPSAGFCVNPSAGFCANHSAGLSARTFYANFTAVFSAISIISVKLSWRSCAERATGLKR